MLSYEEIMNYCSNYKIDNGIVIDKNTNQQVIDEETILKVKTSILLFKESKDAYQSDIQQFGRTNKSQEDYIKKTMEKFGVNNEVNSYGINKLVNAILSSNGHYEEMMSGNDLQNSKFSILVAPKNEYGMAYLKLKFREKGLDIEDLRISQDLSELQHNGVSKVIIDFKIKKYEKVTQNAQNNISQSNIQHPRANELNELERQKQIAKQNNDEVAYNYAQSSIEKIIRETKFEVSPDKWDSMSIQDKIAFVKIKINEARILHNQEDFNYWNSNLNSLNEKLITQSEVSEYHQPSYNSAPTSDESKNDYQEMTQEQEKKDYKYYYQELMKAVEKRTNLVNPTEAEKKQIVGEIFYNQGFLVENLNTQQEFNEVMNLLVNDLNDNQLQKIILTDMQERYNRLFKKKNDSLDNQQQIHTVPKEQTELTTFVNQLREKMNKVNAEYKYMLLDGYIDDVELGILINRTNELIDNSNSLKPLANNQNEIMLLNSITEMFQNEQKKMITMQKGIEKIEETRRTL